MSSDEVDIANGEGGAVEGASELLDAGGGGATRGAMGAEELTHEQEQMLATLRRGEERFRLLSEHIPQVLWIAAPDGSPEYISPGYRRIWGRSIDSYDDWVAAIHPEDRERVAARYGGPGATPELEYRVLLPDGAERWVLDRAYPIRSEDGSVHRIVGTTEDITEWKLAQDRLSAAEAHYRRLVRTSPYGIYAVDREGRFIEVNPAAEGIIGRGAADLMGRPFSELIPPEALQDAEEAFEEILNGGADRFELDLSVQRPSGEIRLLRIAASPIVTDGERSGVHGIARDVTEEAQRDAQRRLLEAALDNLPDALSITGPDLRYRYVNPAHAALFGYDPAQAPEFARPVPDEEAQGQFEEIAESLRRYRRWAGRMRRLREDGTPVLVSTTVFSVSDGREDNALAVMRDASQEISREQHLRRVERLASLGTLIGGVAHEMNNPLTAVVGFAHLMLMDERPAEDREMLEMIAREAERAAKIVADLRLVARSNQTEVPATRSAVDLNELVRHVLSVRRPLLETRRIDVREELADDLPPAWGNRAQLEQVVVNLVINSEHALQHSRPGSRELIVRTQATPLGVALHVIDNGAGIRREHIDRIFDPFFTTRPPGEGTGLGLSLVHSIVTEHRGSLRVESEPDRGAEFVIDLPSPEAT